MAVSIGEEVTGLGARSFTGFGNLSSIVVPKNVTSISGEAFSYSGLTDAVIEDGVTELGYGVFSYCPSLSSVTLPNTLRKIGADVFEECYGLSSVTIPESVDDISQVAFRYSRLSAVTMEGRTKAEAKAVSGYPWGLGNGGVIHCSDGDVVVGDDTVVTYKDGSVQSLQLTGELVRFQIPNWANAVSIEIGRGVTSIANNALFQGDNVETIVVPDSVTSIGENAFAYCPKLTSLTLGQNVESLGSRFI